MGVMTRRRAQQDPATGNAPPSEEVAKVAYELFERRGGLHGHDLQDWFTAERIVRERLQGRRG